MKTLNRKYARGRQRQGASSVEFAFVFPLILIFFLGMIVLTQAFVMRDTCQHAAYEGARKALVLNSTPEEAEEAVEAFLATMKLRDAEITVEPSEFTASTNLVTVTVAIPFKNNAWIAAGFMPENWTTSGKVALRRTVN